MSEKPKGLWADFDSPTIIDNPKVVVEIAEDDEALRAANAALKAMVGK